MVFLRVVIIRSKFDRGTVTSVKSCYNRNDSSGHKKGFLFFREMGTFHFVFFFLSFEQ